MVARHRRATCAAEGRRVFLDCEHFFDGYRARPATTRCEVLRRRGRGRRRRVVLCDTNGGMLPTGRARRRHRRASPRTGARLGIHCQDDTGCAVANTLAAVEAGATHVQGTANGYGERAGNADLFTRRRQPGSSRWAATVLPDGLPAPS